jgi:hypothetical protein
MRGPVHAAIATLAIVTCAVGCAKPAPPTPVAPPSDESGPSPIASAAHPTPSPAAEGVAHPMPNLGMTVNMPETWSIAGSLTAGQAAALASVAPETAQLLEDGWQAVRMGPGGDLGTILVQPDSGMLFIARWLDEQDQDLDLAAAMERVAGRRPRTEELAQVELLGRDALRALLRERIGGKRRVRLLMVMRVAGDRSAAFSITGPAETFDEAAADVAMTSIAESGDPPAGRPWRETHDPILGGRLETLGYDHLLTGDLWTLIRQGGAQGSLLFRAAVTLHPMIAADPNRLRGARTGPSDTSGTGFAEVSAVRIDGQDEVDWAALRPAFDDRGYGPGRVGKCDGLVANPTIDGHAGALVVAEGADFLFEAPDLASIVAVAPRVVDC